MEASPGTISMSKSGIQYDALKRWDQWGEARITEQMSVFVTALALKADENSAVIS